MCLHLLKTDTLTQSPDVAVLVMIDLPHFHDLLSFIGFQHLSIF